MATTKPKDKEEPAVNPMELVYAQLSRNALNYLEKLDRYDCQELLAFSSSHWLLSNEDFRLPHEPPPGLLSQVNMDPNDNKIVILFPEHPDLPPFDYRELHNLVRELTYGIYVLHQSPSISLDPNFDLSTSCHIPPAYMDTRIGQILIAVDYTMKCLWHGAYIPKEKRVKFSERWRSNVDVNQQTGKPETRKSLLNEFINSGLCDITDDPDFAEAYDAMPSEQLGDPKVVEERKFFMTHVDDLCMVMHLYQRSVNFYQNLFLAESDYIVTSCIRLLHDNLDWLGYERLHARLQHQETMIRENIEKKQEILHQLILLKFVSYMTPFLMGMKKRMKIPDISRLLPNLVGDECRTERELPPLILGPDFKCKNFVASPQYFHLHGGIHIDLATSPMTADSSLSIHYDKIMQECSTHLNTLLERLTVDTPVAGLDQNYNMLSFVINGKKYSGICVEFETYYGSIPQKPMWVRAFHEEIIKTKPKKLPMSDIHLQEQFKKFFGYKKAVRYKMPAVGMKAASQRGLVAVFQALCRKSPGSRTGKPDDLGLSLMHYTAMFNRPHVTAVLLMNAAEVNVRRTQVIGSGIQKDDPKGITPLHLAARCGSLSVTHILLGLGASLTDEDHDGWSPIHLAAYFNHVSIIKSLVYKHKPQLELLTNNTCGHTPLLLAASSGGLQALITLISLGAGIHARDNDDNNMVMLATLRMHTNILEFLIKWRNPKIHVWNILVGMLGKSEEHKEKSIRCLDILTNRCSDHWEPILAAGAIPALVELMKEHNTNLQTLTTSVICNISDKQKIREALTLAGAGPILIDLLTSSVNEIQSRAAIILFDMAHLQGNQELIANGVEPLCQLLSSDLEDVLVNATSALRVLCSNNHHNQTEAMKCGVVKPLVEFLTVASDDLQASTASALCALCTNHHKNQDAIMSHDVAKPLVDLLRSSRSITVQVKVAGAIEALVRNNPVSQKVFLRLGAPKALIRLLKNIFTEVREQGANALWALAGDQKTQQKYIAEQVSIAHIIQMLLESTEKLLRVGCMLAIALGQEDVENQIKLAEADAIQQLVRLLRNKKINDTVLLMVIKVIGILCLGVAYRNNKATQRCIADEGGIRVLAQMLMDPPSEEVQVAVANSLACVVLSNRQNQEKLQEEPSFHFDIILNLLKSHRENIRLQAGMALTIFAYNNTPQQLAIREAGGIKFSIFESFFMSNDEYQQCYSAFQVVVLARMIVDWDQVQLTARGISRLVDKLASHDCQVLVLACSLLSSLCHTRAGIPDAIVAAGAINMLVELLRSHNDQVRNGAAVTLGYLSFNKTAARLLQSICRNNPSTFDRLLANLGLDPRICQNFVHNFEKARKAGLPTQWCRTLKSPDISDQNAA